MPKNMRSVVFYGNENIQIQSFNIPHLEPDKLLVHVDACAICTFEQRLFQSNQIKSPSIPGHEVSGHIVAIGELVKGDWKINQNVVVGVTLPCRHCEMCKRHQEQNCYHFDEPKVLPGQPLQGSGGLSEYMLVSPQCVFPYTNIPKLEACLIEPLSCVIHSVNTVNPKLADYVLIIGAGMMGLLHAQLCLKKGCIVIISDPNNERLDIAKELGVQYTINPNITNIHEQIYQICSTGVHIIFDTTPIAKIKESHFPLLRPLGKYMIYSGIYPNQNISIDPHWIHKKGIQILGSANSNDLDFITATRLIQEKIINVSIFIHKSYPVTDAFQALKEACKPDIFRNIIEFGED